MVLAYSLSYHVKVDQGHRNITRRLGCAQNTHFWDVVPCGLLHGSQPPPEGGGHREGRAFPGRRHDLILSCWSHRPTLLLCGKGPHTGDSRGRDHRGHLEAGCHSVPFPQPPTLSGLPRVTPAHPGSLPQTPAAGDLQEVTYAQLDHRMLTQRVAQAASPQSTEPTAESSTYAALTRH